MNVVLDTDYVLIPWEVYRTHGSQYYYLGPIVSNDFFQKRSDLKVSLQLLSGP